MIITNSLLLQRVEKATFGLFEEEKKTDSRDELGQPIRNFLAGQNFDNSKICLLASISSREASLHCFIKILKKCGKHKRTNQLARKFSSCHSEILKLCNPSAGQAQHIIQTQLTFVSH